MSEPSQPISYTFEVVTQPQAYDAARRLRRPYWLHLLLLLLTMLTTLVVGAQLFDNFQRRLPAFTLGDGYMPLFHPLWIWQQPSRLLMGIPFSVALMAILLAHEFGHFFLCEKYGVNATLPFFIPAPTLIGTMGAFIRIKSPIRSRRALFDIGVAGPIAGFVVAFPLLLVGLALSKPLAPVYGVESLGIGFPAVFHLAHWMLKSSSATADAAESSRAASDRGGGMGGDVRHGVEFASRGPTRRGTHHLRGCPSNPQVGEPGLGWGSRSYVVLLDWMAGVGRNSWGDRLEASACPCLAGIGFAAAGDVSRTRAASRTDFCARANPGPGVVLTKQKGTAIAVPRVVNFAGGQAACRNVAWERTSNRRAG